MTSEFLKDRLQKVIELIELAEHDISCIESKPISPYSVLARALCYTVEQVCEHLIALEKSLLEIPNEIPWKDVHGTRVTIAHFYDKISMRIICKTIKDDFPSLKEKIKDIEKRVA